MTTVLERLTAGPKHDPEILLPNVWSDLFHHVEALCHCGSTAPVRKGILDTHEPKAMWDLNGRRRAVISDAYGTGFTCRYSGQAVTLAAALARESRMTGAEQHARDVTQRRLEAGITNTAPAGYALPKPVATLLSLAEANGWTAQQAWAPERDWQGDRIAGEYTVNVRVSRPGGWRYDLSYFVAPGRASRTRFGLCTTPDRRDAHDTPSLKALTAVIRANPVKEG